MQAGLRHCHIIEVRSERRRHVLTEKEVAMRARHWFLDLPSRFARFARRLNLTRHFLNEGTCRSRVFVL